MITEEPELQVTFFPHLYLQRRIWVLDVLRREKVTSILDIGCGEGELLQALCQPTPWLCPPPDASPADISLHDHETLSLHPTHVAGLDISEPDLQFVIGSTAPVDGVCRWEPLQTTIWEGGLEAMNPQFIDTECIVAMEVIEHLPDDTLTFFAPIMLGVYHPRLLLITTPSYTFNARFTAPGATNRTGYHDPSGRTNRLFRHHDHRFEWTVEEFREYCETAATEWGYEVTCATIGYAMERDEWGRDKELGGASQVAQFRRLHDEEHAMMRAKKCEVWIERTKGKPEHRLLATHHHPAHPNAKKPKSAREIGEAVKTLMDQSREVYMRLEEVWFAADIASACGGWIDLLTRAVEEHAQLVLHKEDEGKRGTWRIELVGGRREGSTADELELEMEMARNYNPEVSGEWGSEVYSISAPESVYDAEADDEDEGEDEEGAGSLFGGHQAGAGGWGHWGIQRDHKNDNKEEDSQVC